MNKQLELLAPAGNMETLKAVIHAGADAVYFGGSHFGARAYAGNFNKDEVLEAIDFCHIHDRALFMTVNTLLKERELEEELYTYLLPYYEQGLDGVIVQDFGVMQFIRQQFPELPIHTSTQMTVTNLDGAKFLYEHGASRIVMAREMSLKEIRHIHESLHVEIESFVHGALCYCYSGQCLFSSMLGGRSGNRGRCAQPCRLPYEIYNQNKKRINDNMHLYPLSPKDLCTIDMIPKLAENGVYSFKIEGRMKQTEYAAGVVSVYREYIDKYLEYGASKYKVNLIDSQKLFDFGNRSGFTKGYYEQYNGPDMITFNQPSHGKNNEALWNNISETYVKKELKESISGYMTIQKDTPISFTVILGDVSVTVTGDVPMPAQKQPISRDVIVSKLEKTGNTPFVFEHIEVELEDGLFLPMAVINELRRNALDALITELTNKFRRTPNVHQLPLESTKVENKSNIQCYASVESEEQIAPILKSTSVCGIYVDSLVYSRENLISSMKKLYTQVKESKKELFYILPAVFRKSTSDFYVKIISDIAVDGFLVKSYDALAFLLANDIAPNKIRIDHSMYTWNNRSKTSFLNLGLAGDTMPLELNRKEIAKRENGCTEMVIYGHLPLMTSAQCINKNLTGCDRKSKVYYLKDRYGISFPTKNNCMECYNVIYNSKPLYLFAVLEELQRYHVNRYRLSFTIETGKQVEEVIQKYNQKQFQNMEDYTYGHYKRGAE